MIHVREYRKVCPERPHFRKFIWGKDKGESLSHLNAARISRWHSIIDAIDNDDIRNAFTLVFMPQLNNLKLLARLTEFQ